MSFIQLWEKHTQQSSHLHPGKFTDGTQSHGGGCLEDDFPDFNVVIFRFQPFIFRGVLSQYINLDELAAGHGRLFGQKGGISWSLGRRFVTLT